MTHRRPPSEPIDRWVDRQTRDAEREGLFENLPGTGQPIPGVDRPYDPDWWVKEKLRREEVSMLPDALRLRRNVEEAIARILALPTEERVRAATETLNDHIRAENASIIAGPPSTVMPLDVEHMIDRWRNQKAAP